MEYKKLTQLSPEELDKKLVEDKQILNTLRFAHAVSPLEPEKRKQLSTTRKRIARIKTLQNERKRSQ